MDKVQKKCGILISADCTGICGYCADQAEKPESYTLCFSSGDVKSKVLVKLFQKLAGS